MVLLVIAGVVVIGYMVLGRQGWQHHKQPSQDTGHQTTVAAQKELCAQNEKLCVHYPSSWQAKAMASSTILWCSRARVSS